MRIFQQLEVPPLGEEAVPRLSVSKGVHDQRSNGYDKKRMSVPRPPSALWVCVLEEPPPSRFGPAMAEARGGGAPRSWLRVGSPCSAGKDGPRLYVCGASSPGFKLSPPGLACQFCILSFS